jgi:hypothetical protein
MADTRDPEQAEKEIELVLEEYRSLRNETTQRLSDRGTLTGFATAGAVLVVTHGATTWQYGTAAALLVVSLGVFSVRIGVGVRIIVDSVVSVGRRTQRARNRRLRHRSR